MNNKSMNIVLSLPYRDFADIFKDEIEPNYKDLIKDLPSCTVLRVTSFFNSKLSGKESDYDTQVEILKNWIGRFVEFRDKLYLRFIMNKTAGTSVVIFNNTTNLLLAQIVLESYNDKPDKELSEEEEFRLFKAYLLINQQWVDANYHSVQFPQKVIQDIEAAAIFLPPFLPYADVQKGATIGTQIIKGISFFNYLKKDNQLGIYLNSFLEDYKSETWQKYLLNVFSSFYMKDNQTPYMISISDEHSIMKLWLDNLCIDCNNYKKSDDFTEIREKPLYKFDDNTYFFLNIKFFYDKVFEGIKFDFANSLIKHNAKIGNTLIKNFTDFKKIYSERFMEHALFFPIINYMLKNRTYIKLNSKQLVVEEGISKPDYYIRSGKYIFIIEFKDALFSAKAKHSRDFEIIKTEIKNKFMKSEKGKSKGIAQLINFISSMTPKGFEFDTFNSRNTVIYPIIIFTDPGFDAHFVNYMLDLEFKKMLNEKKYLGKVQSLTMINFDSLVNYQDLFYEKKLKLKEVLDEYLNFIQTTDNFFDRFESFSVFLDNYIKDKKIEVLPPKAISELSKQLFN